LSQAVPLGNDLAVVGQASLDDVGGNATLGTTMTARIAAGALMRPLHALVIAPSIARIAGDPAGTTVILGAALRRGSAVQPLVECEVVDGLFAYESTSVFFDELPKGLVLRAHTHVLGLLLYF
jgi:hypothetical protein